MSHPSYVYKCLQEVVLIAGADMRKESVDGTITFKLVCATKEGSKKSDVYFLIEWWFVKK